MDCERKLKRVNRRTGGLVWAHFDYSLRRPMSSIEPVFTTLDDDVSDKYDAGGLSMGTGKSRQE